MKVIKITFDRLDIEPHPHCMYDFLQINDGNSATAHPIGRYCNSNPPPDDGITSTHDVLYFWFFADASFAHGGFKISWRSVDPGEYFGAASCRTQILRLRAKV